MLAMRPTLAFGTDPIPVTGNQNNSSIMQITDFRGDKPLVYTLSHQPAAEDGMKSCKNSAGGTHYRSSALSLSCCTPRSISLPSCDVWSDFTSDDASLSLGAIPPRNPLIAPHAIRESSVSTSASETSPLPIQIRFQAAVVGWPPIRTLVLRLNRCSGPG